MAIRYCGNVRITVKLNDDYTYSATLGGKRLDGLRMSPFDAARLSADCSEAFDRIAGAACAFATYDDDSLYDLGMDSTDNGSFLISRRKGGKAVTR